MEITPKVKRAVDRAVAAGLTVDRSSTTRAPGKGIAAPDFRASGRGSELLHEWRRSLDGRGRSLDPSGALTSRRVGGLPDTVDPWGPKAK